MYETEIRHSKEGASDITPEVWRYFNRYPDGVNWISVLQWEEHCTECAMPACYQTCDLYEPRSDGKCRRFEGGIVPFVSNDSDSKKIVRVRFKKWGSLMAEGSLKVLKRYEAEALESRAGRLSSMVSFSRFNNFSILGRKGLLSRLVRRIKRRWIRKIYTIDAFTGNAEHFLMEVYNPGDQLVNVTLVIRSSSESKSSMPFQKLLSLPPGFCEVKINFREIAPFVGKDNGHYFSITPNIADVGRGTNIVELYFGFLGLISSLYDCGQISSEKKKSIKIVVWDLDNTIWNGVLVEDGSSNLQLMTDIDRVIKVLDSRGIVNSIISKNNHDEAWAQLKKFGLDQYMVFPKISWDPKSSSMKSLIEDFNVGPDTVAFIDDSPFERREVKDSNPLIHVFDASDYKLLVDMPMFDPEISSESSGRREFYKSQGRRSQSQSGFSGEYFDFLRACEIKLSIQRANTKNIDRIHELVQRTNQMNFSGRRYSREDILEMIDRQEFDNYCLICSDKFGDYGTVGFCIIDAQNGLLRDLMFSCRIQSKRVEHAFLSAILEYYRNKGLDNFVALYNKNAKNEPAGRVFMDIGFTILEHDDGLYTYNFDMNKSINKDGLISVNFE